MMTRKRFIKLLMSQGYSRNGANRLADEARAVMCSMQSFIMLMQE